MQTKHRRRIRQRQRLDVRHGVLRRVAVHEGVVGARPREVEGLAVEQKVAHVLCQVRCQDSAVHVVGDSAAVHGVADEVLERPPGQFLVASVKCLFQVQRKQFPRNLKVTLVEVVADVPADLAVLPALLHHRVQPRQHEQARGKGGMRALVVDGLVHLGVRRPHVQLQAVGRLRHHFQRPLQDAQREAVRGLGREPEAKVLVGRLHQFEPLLQLLQPRDEQMAVLQQDPVALGRALLDELLCLWALALAQRDEAEL
mmetsp:Transcript_25191/g.84666  ORF Transcript_25191/g.84666 Transcript_25191/m.84666 type:complete len:256 (-) Transcript_25191:12061-12828(-)